MSRFRAFTLVELLVVIGIIAALIAILPPALNKAREAARSVQCMSNMRQIALATMSFARERRGYMPARGDKSPWGYTASGQPGVNLGAAGSTFADERANWIIWQRRTDKFSGAATNDPNRIANITYSALARYLGTIQKPTNMSNPGSEHHVSDALEALFTCPSDKPEKRNTMNLSPGEDIYHFSYSMNVAFTMPIRQPKDIAFTSWQAVGSPTMATGQRDGFVFTGKIESIKSSSNRVLLICEDEATLDDGTYNPDVYKWISATPTAVASLAGRHGSKSANQTISGTNGSYRSTSAFNADVQGNAAMADGHVQKLGRKDALRARYSGVPFPDPAGF